ncbi:RluA family pseudouridine synthase [Pontibacillus salicampi]|uniref:Pseudouridine synthase n=1 Tax=Pontibacillus salicampi TaxID=1449801 RepID=A0ABV6LKQ4_9BACI
MELKKLGQWLEITVPQKWEAILEEILKHHLHIPKKQLHALRMEQGVTVNGEQVKWTNRVHAGDLLQVRLFQEEHLGVIPTEKSPDILWEDDHVLVANKPAGINVHPNEADQTDTLANQVAHYFKKTGIHAKVRHVHRLDQNTTGAVLFAKHALAGAEMDRLLENRAIKRTYMALVKGRLEHHTGKVTKPIGKDRHHPTRRRVSPKGQHATTSYEVIHYDAKKNATLVKLQLQTGRTHQIRVHMSYLGHPLLGDKLYGGPNGTRQALHAGHIQFPHPISGETISCMAPFTDNPPIFPGNVEAYIK